MIRRHPPHKMLSLLIILLAMVVYFSLDLYWRENQSKSDSGTPQTKNVTDSRSQTGPDTDNAPEPQSDTKVEGGRAEDKIIGPDAVIITEKRYTVCGHVIKKHTSVPEDMVNLTEYQLQKAYKDWTLKEFSPNQVVIYQEVHSKCPDHFVLIDKDGLVAIYYQTPVDGVSLKEVTPISVKSLRSQDRNRLKSGIKVESKKELAQVLEDLGS